MAVKVLAIVLAGGEGKRLMPLTADRAKPGVPFGGISLALYDEHDLGQPLNITCALPVPDDVTIDDDGLSTVDLPAVQRAATTVVRGAPDQFGDGFRALHEWAERNGDRTAGVERELYVDCDGPPDTWVTELQTVLEPKA